jgi:hypothetical protein
MSTTKPIRVLMNFRSLPDGDLQNRAGAVWTGLSGNPNFPNPPVDLNALKSSIDMLAELVVEALDGSKKVKAAKTKQREVLAKMLRQLAIYAETNCNDDPAVFVTSGFLAASTTRTLTPQPLDKPVVKRIDQGSISGELLVRITSVPNAASYELRYAVETDLLPGEWTILTMTTVKSAVSVKTLKPGTIYAFQVRGLGKLGYTDWSSSKTRMVI